MADNGPVFIIDNRAEEGTEKVEEYLGRWCNFSETFDIATGYFEIGALRRMDGQWQKFDKIRILMGDETSKSTKSTILNVINCKLDESFDKEKDEERTMNIGEDDLSNARRKIENHIFSTIVRDMRIPIGHDPVLQCWMSLG